ncbi:MAG: CHRD domain-containing protein [Gammaproteobacteria bacterium]|nr:CHRD domain-containing protein [Gammaproteobacteria bacterium]MDE2263624.1 CHRD domain-containing protein [Gammaproteobacteria bacterium]
MRFISRRAAVTAASVLLAAGLGVASAATVRIQLTGSHEAPPVKTMARGSGVIEVAADGSVSGKIATRGIKGTMAHIHEGAPGQDGPPIISLAPGPHGTWVVPAGSKLSPHQYKEFLAGDLYVNVHSAAHPGGEIRGQLKP